MRVSLRAVGAARPLAIASLAAVGLAVAGCGQGSGLAGPSPSATPTTGTSVPGSPSGGPSGSPGGTAPGTGAPVATCVVGDWLGTGATGQAATNGASATISGGEGIRLGVRPDGRATVDFTGMRPATFTVTVSGTEAAGQFTYAGTVDGTVRTGGGTAATSGDWEPVGTVDWGRLRLTVDLTKPIRARPLDNVRIGDYVGPNADQTGNVVDVDPMLGSGTFRCEGDTLTLAAKKGGITWNLRRA